MLIFASKFFRVDFLENHYKQEAEKKSRRRKRKVRSGKKKKVVEINGQQMREKLSSLDRKHWREVCLYIVSKFKLYDKLKL